MFTSNNKRHNLTSSYVTYKIPIQCASPYLYTYIHSYYYSRSRCRDENCFRWKPCIRSFQINSSAYNNLRYFLSLTYRQKISAKSGKEFYSLNRRSVIIIIILVSLYSNFAFLSSYTLTTVIFCLLIGTSCYPLKLDTFMAINSFFNPRILYGYTYLLHATLVYFLFYFILFYSLVVIG